MMLFVSLAMVTIFAAIAYVGTEWGHLSFLFGIVFPYAALILFIGGVIYRIVQWAKAPVPFRIPTTCGQQQSLPWIRSNPLECPHNILCVFGRMTLEILLFRSLFRNTKTELRDGPRLVYGSDKYLWAAGLAFHYSFLVIVLRHLRFFIDPIPPAVTFLEKMDSLFQIGLPVLYMTDAIFLTAVSYLFLRRVFISQVRYISLVSDYFPLFLLLAIAITGVLLRHYFKTDVVQIKALAIGIVSFHPVLPTNPGSLFYVHLFLVCVLLAYLPFSKLMHLAGVFLSPTRNLANNSRMRRHVNPWDYPVKVHTYEEYENEFREKMKDAGLPVEKE
ncbi:MAG TPA: sulfate reduction electron transfer complex DsrMKJOP subunit DsrM [bacterium]|nr:sulfate reduction electron transfer complex DsrMKJOP subunit DsrM [bacterium]